MSAENEHYGQRMRRLRESQLIGVDVLAEIVGVTPGAIRRMESGETKDPGIFKALRIAAALGVDAESLFLGTPSPKARILAMQEELDRQIEALQERVRRLEER